MTQQRLASLLPSECREEDEQPASAGPVERVPDPLDSIRSFRLTGDREVRACYKVPAHLHRGLESAVAILASSRRWETSVTHVGAWALSLGLSRLRALPDVQTIVDARTDLLNRGCDTSFADEWSYQLQTYGRRTVRVDLRRLDPAVGPQCKDTAAGLGLEISTVAALAMMAALIDVPLQGAVPGQMETELGGFVKALRQRAVLVLELRAHAVPAATSPRTPWKDLVAKAVKE